VVGPNVISISCDVAEPYFGLDRARLREISNGLDCIVHAAAVTDFAKPDELIMRTNVRGVENALELAALAQVPLYHISTAFVREKADKTAGKATERDPAYVLSKREGERLVRESGLPNMIIRPSIVIGDSTSGMISRFQGFYSVIGAIFRGLLPILPTVPEALIDFIPQDVMANAVVELIEHEYIGKEVWLTSGNRALTMQQIISIGAEVAVNLGYKVAPPKLIHPDTFNRLVRPVFLSAFPKYVQRGLERLAKVTAFMSTEQQFPTSLPKIASDFGWMSLPDVENSFARSFEYWMAMTKHTQSPTQTLETP
jgi:nucleoside-diphosphate-sugar epimerase